MTAASNVHATALLIGDRGILITGVSGAGKTTLALALIERFAMPGRLSRLVGDDQLFASAKGGRLVCRAPASIAGLVEVHGIGPRAVPCEPALVVDLVLRLVPAAGIERFQPDATDWIAGCAVPRIDLAERNVNAALPVVAARLGLAPFV
jgi:serine kinase of HPr protein (carbohydrate metabolism regulator)